MYYPAFSFVGESGKTDSPYKGIEMINTASPFQKTRLRKKERSLVSTVVILLGCRSSLTLSI